MAENKTFFAVVFFLLMILVFVAVVGLTWAQGNSEHLVNTARFHLETCPGSQNTTQVVIVDSTTGQCWVYRGGKSWKDMGSPFQREEIPHD